jgi:phage terminase large subunit-like protein
MKWSAFSAKLSSALSASSAAGKLSEDLAELAAELGPEHLRLILAHWPLWARPDQLPPAVNEAGETWRVWLILGGRGAGKTRAGAEWVSGKALGRSLTGAPAAQRIALVGETIGDVRRVMIEGISGLLSVHTPRDRPRFEPSKGQLSWPSGAIAQMFSAEDPDSLRGPQFDAAWCAKWRHPERTWDKLQFALRLGEHPQMVATTTPRSTPWLKKLVADEGTVATRAATADNADNLAPTFVSEMTRRYAGRALGRQELLGELVDDTSGALWRRDWIEAHRVAQAPELSQRPMTEIASETQPAAKWWGQSITIWGAIITGLSTVLPALGPAIGIDVTGDLVREAGEGIVQTAQAVGGLLGTVMTIYGRIRATKPLEQRSVQVNL